MSKASSVQRRYKSTAILILSIILLLLIADTPLVRLIIVEIGCYGYLGAFITGVFFVSTFTVVPATVVLYHLAQEFNPVTIAVFGGAGAALGDLLIFRFFTDSVYAELAPLFRRIRGSRFAVIFKSPYFAWLLPLVGMIIIISPFSDEIGIGLLGLTRLKAWQFLLLTFVLNAIGIFAIITAVMII